MTGWREERARKQMDEPLTDGGNTGRAEGNCAERAPREADAAAALHHERTRRRFQADSPVHRGFSAEFGPQKTHNGRRLELVSSAAAFSRSRPTLRPHRALISPPLERAANEDF